MSNFDSHRFLKAPQRCSSIPQRPFRTAAGGTGRRTPGDRWARRLTCRRGMDPRRGERSGGGRPSRPVIPSDVRISTGDPNGAIYLTDPVTLAAGDCRAFFSARSLAPGSVGNAPAGVFNRHNFTGYTDSRFGTLLVTNNFGLVGGRDAESDDDYRFRLSLKVQSSAGANEAALRLELLEIPGIQDVVFERQAGAFIVYIYGISPNVSPDLRQVGTETPKRPY